MTALISQQDLLKAERFDLRTAGQFKEKDGGKTFWYYEGAHDEWALKNGATHTLQLGHKPVGQSMFRAAKILKTVAYVAVDEDELGNAVWEKWNYRWHEQYGVAK